MGVRKRSRVPGCSVEGPRRLGAAGPLLEDWDIISPREVAAAEPLPERRSLLAAALPFTQALLAQVSGTGASGGVPRVPRPAETLWSAPATLAVPVPSRCFWFPSALLLRS